MFKINEIVISNTTPLTTNVIWVKPVSFGLYKLLVYTDSGWTSVSPDESKQALINASTEYNTLHSIETLTLQQAVNKVPEADKGLGKMITYFDGTNWQFRQYAGTTLSDWNIVGNWVTVSSSTIDYTGFPLYNITVAVPLTAGQYYTATAARAAVPVNVRKRGLEILYETSSGVWYSERFIGASVTDWTLVNNWEVVLSKTYIDTQDALKIDKTSITSELGDSEELVVSQKAVTDGLALKADQTELNTKLQKNIPNIIITKAKYLYTEKTATTNSGLISKSTALSSGYISVNEGDIINCINGYGGEVSFYNSDKTSRVIVNVPATAPAGYPYAAIMYGYNNLGGYEEAYVQIVPADSAKKIGYNAINFVAQQAVNNPLLVESAKISWERYLQQSIIVQGTNLFNKTNIVNGLVNYSSIVGGKIAITENTNFVTSKILAKDLSTITVKGIRAIAFADSDDNIVATGALINNQISNTISLPTNTFYCYVSVYTTNNNLNIAQINIGSTLLSYEDYKFDLKFNGKLLIYELQESLKILQNNDVIIQSLFEYGNVTGAGELINATNRIRSRFPLKDGVKYSFSLSSKSGSNVFTKLVPFYETSSGQLISNGDSTEITGSSSIIAFWFVAKKTDNSEILNWEKDDCILLSNYIDDINALINELQVQIDTNDEEISNLYEQINVENSILKKGNSSLNEQLNFQNERIKSLSGYKINNTDTDVTLQLNRSTGGKLILNLHKRTNNGYYENNNIYFPNCRTDFSDVNIKDDKGNVLPFRFIYRGNIDILPDQRLSNVQLVRKDSFGVSYSGKDNKIKKSTDGCITWDEISIFNDLSYPVVSLISTVTNTMFVGSKGKLYRSEYPYSTKTMVLDFNVYHANSVVLSHSMVQHPDGDLFIGSYQVEFDARIFKSTDNGVTWSQVYQTTAYQHVHRMSIDINQSPIAIYAGLDGGGAILKTTDKGVTWTNLRTLNPSIPQATDDGIIYSDKSGYRFSGGETSIVGGHSILKTTDDITFRPVLSCGKAVHFVEKLNNKLFAGALSSGSFRSTSIMVSEDEGETWTTAYFTENFNEGGASDGYRYLSKDSFGGKEFLIAGIQSNSRLPLRILSDSDSYFAAILVEIPSGCEQITVGDGYILSNEKQIINDSSDLNRKLYIGLNEDNDYISIDENGSKSFIKKEFLFSECGKKLGEIYPPIVSYDNKKSAKITMLNYFEVNNIDLSNGNFSIGFWMKSDEYSYSIELIKSNNFSLTIRGGYQLHLNGSWISSFGYPIVFGVMNRVDIGLSSTGVITVYLNGILQATYNSTSSIYADLDKFYVLNVPYIANGNADTVIQNFSIREGVVTQEEANNNYYSEIFDNI